MTEDSGDVKVRLNQFSGGINNPKPGFSSKLYLFGGESISAITPESNGKRNCQHSL